MNKSALAAAVGLALGGVGVMNAQAALTTTSILAYDAGSVGNFTTAAGAGASYFTMIVDTKGTILYTGLQVGTDGGVHIGAAQPLGTAASHGGLPYAIQATQPTNPYYGNTYTTDHGPIDMGWGFFGNTGLHFTASAVDVVTDSGTTKTLDFSGWRVSWNGIPSINMGGGTQTVTSKTGTATLNNGSGLATITCSNSSCSASSNWTLDYAAVVPVGDPSGFGGTPYTLHLSNPSHTTAVVPVPAAVWLFGSGLLGLVGIARRKKASA
jgi:hypothetical protein